MKNVFFIALLFVLAACEEKYEVIHRYSRPYNLTKDYPIYLDASEILVDIQVKPPVDNKGEAFKIASNDHYFFVGEKMKGIHVYEKTDKFRADPLCFIECKHLKAFDVADNILYCNNFVDLLAIDVENPLQAKIIHREANFFNKYSSSYQNMMNYYLNGVNMYIIGYKTIVLEGIETDVNPVPDFSEYDALYGNMIVKQIPDTLKVDKPCAGFANIDGKIHTFGYNSLALCSFASGVFEIIRTSISFYHYTYVTFDNLLYKNGKIIFFWHTTNFSISSSDYNYGVSGNILLDVVPLMNQENNYIALSDSHLVGFFTDGVNIYHDSMDSFGSTSLLNVNDTILALGARLMLYHCSLRNNKRSIEQVKQYRNISGTSMLKEGDVLIVASKQGLSFYDISDLENIMPLP